MHDVEWRDVVGYEGLYQVNNVGQVKRLGGSPRRKNDRILVQGHHTHGYRSVALSKDGKVTTYTVHSLVMRAFVGEPNGMWCNHKNGIKTDNRLENLEYVTPSDNNQHAYNTGLRRIRRGKDHHSTRVSDETISLVDHAYKYAYDMFDRSRKKLAEASGISVTTLHMIIHRQGRFADDE